jgi:hypothetical protein
VIEAVDGKVVAWVQGAVAPTPVTLAAPSDDNATEGIRVYLMELVRKPSVRSGPAKPPLEISLRYLVTSHAREVTEAHRRLWDLMVRAVAKSEEGDWEVEPDPIPLEAWQAFGVAPCPSFVLTVPARHEWERPVPQLVREAPVVETSPACSLEGYVLGPRDIPLAGASVVLPSLGLSTVAGTGGRFRFASVPAGRRFPAELFIEARGRRLTVPLDREAAGEPLQIRIRLDEG